MEVEPQPARQSRQDQDQAGQDVNAPKEKATQCHGRGCQEPRIRKSGRAFGKTRFGGLGVWKGTSLDGPRTVCQSGQGFGVQGPFRFLDALVQ